VPLLHVLKTQEQPLAFVFSRKGPIDPSPYNMHNWALIMVSATPAVDAQVEAPNYLRK
jgi:hypothetical protein